jgi:hypothetical protein
MQYVRLLFCRSLGAFLLILGIFILSGCMRRYVSVEEVDKMIKD